MKKINLSFIFGVIITSSLFGNNNIAISKMSRSSSQTQFIVKQIGGMIKYDDGQIMENEDAYVVWTCNQAEFTGLNEDGTVLNPSNSVVLCKFNIKNGKIKPFSGSYGYMLGNSKKGDIRVVTMDSRIYQTNEVDNIETDITNTVYTITNEVETVEETDKTDKSDPINPNPIVVPTEKDDNTDTIIPTDDPIKELDVVDLNEVYKKTQTRYAIIYDKKRKFGYGTLKIGKRNKKTGKVRLDLLCYFFDGKSTKSSLYVIPDEYGMIDGEFGLPEAYGDYLRFSMFYDQDINDFIFSGNNDFYKVETFDNMGGEYKEPTEFSFSIDLDECPALDDYNFVIDALPINEYVLIKNKTRFYTNKSANIKYKKSNGKYYIDGLDDPNRPNLSGLKIINYNSKNGYFKGYFYLYTEHISSNKKQYLKKHKVTLNGILFEGQASGFGRVKIDGIQYFIPFEMK